MNDKRRKKLTQSKRRIERRLDKNDNTGCERPMITASNIHYDIAERTRAVAAGGIGAMHLVAKKLGLVEAIDRKLHLLKVHLPYHGKYSPKVWIVGKLIWRRSGAWSIAAHYECFACGTDSR